MLLFAGVMGSLFNCIGIFCAAKAAGIGEDRKMAENAEKLGQVQDQREGRCVCVYVRA